MGGANLSMYALAVSASNVYAGGVFTLQDGRGATNIANWNGSNWSALGSGLGTVRALAVSGSELYAASDFAVVKWNGSNWSSLGSGMNNRVYALAVWGGDVYAGGWFERAGGIPATNIAKWNGSSWSALGLGMRGGGSVYALAVSGSDLYAGGAFTNAGGAAANYIAKWNGSNWSALDSGMDDWVWTLAVSGTNLYAGGYFDTAGGSAANGIAKWNGSTWSALGSGMNGTVFALAVSGNGDLYAGGAFGTVGGRKWDGHSWSALGSGLNGTVYALAVSGSDLYAAGGFTIAGGKVSRCVARAFLELPTLSILRSGGDVTLSWPTFYETFLLQQNPDAANSNAWADAIYPLTTNGAIKSATAPITPTNQFFRLIGN